MKRLIILFLALACLGTFAVEAQTNDNPQESRHEQRRRQKEEKTREYCMFMDSLVRSGVYTFHPRSFQLQPAGKNQFINNTNFRVEVREDYIDIYLPFYSGSYPPYRLTTINYTLPYIGDYRSEQSEDGLEWTITFSNNLFSADTYNFKFTVTTCTGNTELEIKSPSNQTVTYNGYLSKYY